MNCRRCHKTLKREPGISQGIGPVCARKEQAENQEKESAYNYLNVNMVYDGGDIYCKRDRGIRTTNVHHAIVYHSPDGFEWGYGGSGPAELALNILAMFVDHDTAFKLHQEFKWKFIASMPQEGGTIKRADIEEWIEANRRAA